MSEIEWLFNHLWMKPHLMAISTNDKKEFDKIKSKRMEMKVVKFPFKIPETLIYKEGKLHTWYFRAKESVVLK